MSQVWDHSKQTGARLLLMLAIADHADDNGIAWPGIPSLSRKIRMSTRYTEMLQQRLIESGELSISRAGGGRQITNRYQITIPEAGLGVKNTEAGLGVKKKTPRRGSENPEAGLGGTVKNHQEPQNKLIDSSSASAVATNATKPAAAAAVVWGWDGLDLSRVSLRKLKQAGAEPAAYVAHYLQAVCNPRVKSPAGVAIAATCDRPDGPQAPWAQLAQLDPWQMAEALLNMRDGGHAGPLAEVARSVNGRHAEVAGQAIADLGLVDLVGRLHAARQAALAAAPEFTPQEPEKADAWREIMRCKHPVYGKNFKSWRHYFETAHLVSDTDGELVVAVDESAMRLLDAKSKGWRREMFGDQKITFIQEEE